MAHSHAHKKEKKKIDDYFWRNNEKLNSFETGKSSLTILDGGDDTRVEGVPRGADVLGRVPTRGGGNRGVCGVVDDFGF